MPPEINPDPNVTASAPPIEQQSANVPATLQAPAAAPPVQNVNLVPPAAQPITATSPNKHLMSLGARILGALAGENPQYSYDANGKRISSAAPLTTTQKIGRIVGKTTAALAAPTPEGRMSLAANVGAGAQAVKQQSQGQDVLKRAQAKEAFEVEQQAKLRQHEIARSNALTLSTYYGAKKMANDMDPHFAQNESLMNAVKASPELGAHVTEMSDTQVAQEAAKDPAFATKHIIKPLGWAPETDANGQQVTVDGEPKFFMRMMVVDGTKDGKIAVTPELAEDFKKYGPMARIPNAGDLKAGDTYDLAQLLPAMNKVEEQRKAVLDGWQKSTLGWPIDPVTGKEGTTPVEINSVLPPGSPDRTRPLTVKPMAMEAEEGKTALEKAQAQEARAKAQESLANAAMISSTIGTGNQAGIPKYVDAITKLPQSSQTILKNVPPMQQMALLKVANGDADINKIFPTRTTKGSGQLDAAHATTLVSLLNPRWSEQMFKEKQGVIEKLSKDPAIASFNQFLFHADEARQASIALDRTNSPWLNEPLNVVKNKGMGEAGVPELLAAIKAAREEWNTFIKSGHAEDLAGSEESRKIMSDASSPRAILGVLRLMGGQAIGRLDQIDSQYRRAYGEHYAGLISSTGRQAAKNLGLEKEISQYPDETAFGGASPTGIPNTAINSPKPLTNLHSDGKVTIGWDGAQWVDQATNQPYKP